MPRRMFSAVSKSRCVCNSAFSSESRRERRNMPINRESQLRKATIAVLLFVTQGSDGIEPRGAPRREIAGQHSHAEKKHASGCDCCRIAGTDAKQEPGKQRHKSQRKP